MIDKGEAIRRIALNMARYSGIAPLAAPFFSGRGAILMLHHVNREPLPALGINRHLTVTPEFLERVLADLKRAGHAFVSMDEAVEALKKGHCSRLVTITADDGYRDNITDALPVLEGHDVPLTIYVSPALIDRSIDLWWDVLEEIVMRSDRVELDTAAGTLAFDCRTIPMKIEAGCRIHDYLTTAVKEEDRQPVLDRLARAAGVDPKALSVKTLLDWDEIRAASEHRLVTIGAHGISHYNLKRLDDAAAFREISEAGCMVENAIGKRPRHMAYPYGYASAVGAREVEMARDAGYASAVTTRHGVLQARHASHMHALPRISLNGRYQNPAHIRTMLSGITTAMSNSGRRLVTV